MYFATSCGKIVSGCVGTWKASIPWHWLFGGRRSGLACSAKAPHKRSCIAQAQKRCLSP